MISQNKEDYIKAIYHLENELKGAVKSIELVNYLQISKPSVSEMLKKLIKLKLVFYKKNRLTLTKKGIKEAEWITYKHRIIEVFLTEMLKLEPSLIHNEGNRLEHSFSDKSIKKLSILLGNPQFCPHGKPIPQVNFKRESKK